MRDEEDSLHIYEYNILHLTTIEQNEIIQRITTANRQLHHNQGKQEEKNIMREGTLLT